MGQLKKWAPSSGQVFRIWYYICPKYSDQNRGQIQIGSFEVLGSWALAPVPTNLLVNNLLWNVIYTAQLRKKLFRSGWNRMLIYLIVNYALFSNVAISVIFSSFFIITFDWNKNFEFWWFHRKDLVQIYQNILYFNFLKYLFITYKLIFIEKNIYFFLQLK